MSNLSPRYVSKEIFTMLTMDSQPPAFAPEWRDSKASSYLSICKRLFSTEDKRHDVVALKK